MAIPWIELLLFPGILFTLGLTVLFEQITSRIYSRFAYKAEGAPMFIPIIEHFKLCLHGEQEKTNLKSILQGVLLVILLSLSLFSALILPIGYMGKTPVRVGEYGTNLGSDEGIVGVIAFEGDLLLMLTISVLIGLLVFFIIWLGEKNTTYEALKTALTFMLFDIPLFLSFAGPAIVRRTMSVSVLAEDIRLIAYFNPGFSLFLLLPWGTLVSILALTFKFDQPYFDRLNTTPDIALRTPMARNWKFHIWNIALRMYELVIAGTIVSIFLCGAYIPIPIHTNYELLGHVFNFIFKLAIVFVIVTLIRCAVPRLKAHQVMNINFKILVPTALVAMLLIGVVGSINGIS